MLSNFLVYSLVQLTVVNKHVLHLLDLLHNKSVFLNERLHGNTPADELLIDGYKIVQVLVVDQLLKLLDLVL